MVELMVVIVIIAIITVVVVPIFRNYVRRSINAGGVALLGG